MDHYPYLVRRIRKIGPRIDLGCGKTPRPGYIGMDIQDFGQDILWDIREGIPLPDNSVSSFYSSHFVEHLSNAELIVFWKEVLRVCCHLARVEIKCPHEDHIEAFYSSHLSKWNAQRIRGAAMGTRNNPAVRKYFNVESVQHTGIELYAILAVKLKQ